MRRIAVALSAFLVTAVGLLSSTQAAFASGAISHPHRNFVTAQAVSHHAGSPAWEIALTVVALAVVVAVATVLSLMTRNPHHSPKWGIVR
jgi:hypothetical protein